MTDPSQYFKGRTVQEQMDEVIGYVDVRSAEVATAAIAADVAQVHQDMLDADADATAAAASAAAAAGTLANAVKKTGEASQSIAGDINVSNDLMVGGDAGVTGDAGVQGQLSVLGGCDLRAPVTVPTPTNNTDAATKKYVDDATILLIPITDINTYAVGLTGNQDSISGRKTFENDEIRLKQGSTYFNARVDVTHGNERYGVISLSNPNNIYEACIQVVNLPDGTCKLEFYRYNTSDGTAIVHTIDTIS